MSNFKRQAIVSIAAIVGAQLSAIAFSSQPGQTSNDCFSWAQNAIGRATGEQAEPERTDSMSYWDVRYKREMKLFPVGQAPAAPVPAPAVPHTPFSDRDAVPGMPTAAQPATTQSIWAREHRLPRPDEIEAYNAFRRSGNASSGVNVGL